MHFRVKIVAALRWTKSSFKQFRKKGKLSMVIGFLISQLSGGLIFYQFIPRGEKAVVISSAPTGKGQQCKEEMKIYERKGVVIIIVYRNVLCYPKHRKKRHQNKKYLVNDPSIHQACGTKPATLQEFLP